MSQRKFAAQEIGGDPTTVHALGTRLRYRLIGAQTASRRAPDATSI